MSCNEVVSEYSDDVFEDLFSLLDDSSEIESSGTSEVSEKRQRNQSKPKRVRKRVRPPGLYVLKDDIRKSYANMMTNVVNSGDFPLMFGFLHTFYVPNVKSSLRAMGGGVLANDYSLSVSGMNRVAQYSYNTMLLSPDLTMELLHSHVEIMTGRIVCKLVSNATLLYDDESIAEVSRSQKWMCSDDPTAEYSSDYSTMNKIVDNVESSMSRLRLRDTPIKLTVPCTLIMCIDDDKRIISEEIIFDRAYDESVFKSFVIVEHKE